MPPPTALARAQKEKFNYLSKLAPFKYLLNDRLEHQVNVVFLAIRKECSAYGTTFAIIAWYNVPVSAVVRVVVHV